MQGANPLPTGTSVTDFILSYKDFFAIIFGFVALVVSGITLMQKVTEVRRTLRNQISDVMSKLSAATIELEKLRSSTTTELNKTGPQLDRVKRQISALAQQADYLIQQIPSYVSDVEYANVALAFDTVSDSFMADFYWKETIKARHIKRPWYRRVLRRKKPQELTWHSDIIKAIHMRRYGAFLYAQDDHARGYEQYDSAINLLETIKQEQALWELGFAYRKWAQSKVENMPKDLTPKALQVLQEDVSKLLKKAREAYEGLKNKKRVERAKLELEDERGWIDRELKGYKNAS